MGLCIGYQYKTFYPVGITGVILGLKLFIENEIERKHSNSFKYKDLSAFIFIGNDNCFKTYCIFLLGIRD